MTLSVHRLCCFGMCASEIVQMFKCVAYELWIVTQPTANIQNLY